MSHQNDKVSDVIGVLAAMRSDFRRRPRNVSEIRKEAVADIAETALVSGRFLNQDSARKSIHDACARRLGITIKDFDALADQWLRSNNFKQLRDILLDNSTGVSQHAEVTNFFKDSR